MQQWNTHTLNTHHWFSTSIRFTQRLVLVLLLQTGPGGEPRSKALFQINVSSVGRGVCRIEKWILMDHLCLNDRFYLVSNTCNKQKTPNRLHLKGGSVLEGFQSQRYILKTYGGTAKLSLLNIYICLDVMFYSISWKYASANRTLFIATLNLDLFLNDLPNQCCCRVYLYVSRMEEWHVKIHSSLVVNIPTCYWKQKLTININIPKT